MYVLLEYCPGGTLFDLIENYSNKGGEGIPEGLVLNVLSDIVSGLIHMHMQDPPIAHRDIKIENILFGSDNKWKLCDLGSSTTKFIAKVREYDREIINQEIEETTTPVYRAPEQLDLYSGFPINEKVDIWALGCLLYTLMFFKSPFQPGEKLAQINANVKYPENKYSDGLMHLLKQML